MAHTTRKDDVLMTPEELLVRSLPDGKAELVRGELRVTSPAGGPHLCVSSNIHALLSVYLKGRGLGRAFRDGGYELVESAMPIRASAATDWFASPAAFVTTLARTNSR